MEIPSKLVNKASDGFHVSNSRS